MPDALPIVGAPLGAAPEPSPPPAACKLTQIRAYAALATRMSRELRRAEQCAWELAYLHAALGIGHAANPASALAGVADANGYIPNTDVPAADLDAILLFIRDVSPILATYRDALRRVAGAEGF